MQLNRLQLKEFRNLKDIEVNFSQTLQPLYSNDSVASKSIRSHAIIGQNGVGKSNLIEALVHIFRNIDLELPVPFDYELEYTINGNHIKVVGNKALQSRPFVWVGGEKQSQSYLKSNENQLLPAHVFVYYSGKNERIENLFKDHQENYKKLLKNNKDDLVRRLFYCRGGHAQLVLLACMLDEKDATFRRILDNLGIEAIESANFVLKKPYAQRKLEELDILEGDPRYWYTRGTVVNKFLSYLWDVAWAPIQDTREAIVDFRRRPEKQELLYMFVPNQKALKKLGDAVGTSGRFFRYAEAAYIGDLLEEVRIKVKKRDLKGNVEFTDLSEGELQLLTVLGLMRLTHQENCLFLLDEPDTHLNPIWKLRFFDDIENVLRQDKNDLLKGESQIFITTHDPIMVGSLRKEQVHIIRRVDEITVIEQPYEHPQGMGVSGLLKSELFGLPSTLDNHTLEELQRRNELLAKRGNGTISNMENEELKKLANRLDNLGFSHEYKDPMYQLFIEQMYKVRRKPLNELLNQEELLTQNALAEQILDELVKSQRMDELSTLAKELMGKG